MFIFVLCMATIIKHISSSDSLFSASVFVAFIPFSKLSFVTECPEKRMLDYLNPKSHFFIYNRKYNMACFLSYWFIQHFCAYNSVCSNIFQNNEFLDKKSLKIRFDDLMKLNTVKLYYNVQLSLAQPFDTVKLFTLFTCKLKTATRLYAKYSSIIEFCAMLPRVNFCVRNRFQRCREFGSFSFLHTQTQPGIFEVVIEISLELTVRTTGHFKQFVNNLTCKQSHGFYIW